MKKFLLLILWAAPVAAHHGVASLGAAGLEGPGAPIETTVSATLPPGRWLGYVKLDQAEFKKLTPERDDEGDVSSFWMYGLGYGVKPWLSLYGFLPYTAKVSEDNSYNTAGFSDVSLMGVLGVAYDGRWRLVADKESLDDLEDWHFSLFAGMTLPTGHADERDADGQIDPGMSLGFGGPSYTAGLSATKARGRHTLNADVSGQWFTTHEYADHQRMRFGRELRLNAAYVNRLSVNAARKRRIDAILEANALALGRDRTDGVAEPGTGGRILYLTPGVRLYFDNLSLGLGVKRWIWRKLNEESLQQGAEGKERHRLLATFSVLY